MVEKTMIRFLLLFHLFLPITGSFHLYNTYTADNHDYKDCLYSFDLNDADRTWTLIPYCIRHDVQGSDDTNTQCNGDEVYSFNQLKADNVSSVDLYSWHAPIDVIDDYQRYLINDKMSLTSQSYCNCSSRWFGTQCQYTFDQTGETVTFDDIIISQIDEKQSLANYFDIVNDSSLLTCYEGLQCHSTICLDWREICDGNINCEYGEDEPDECLLLELNQCQTDEYRCRNGMCIPKTFLLDFSYDCIDLSDEQNAAEIPPWSIVCYRVPFGDCDIISCRESEYSCGDGMCISAHEACHNGRDMFLRRNLLLSSVPNQTVTSNNITLDCWFLMLCMSGEINTYLSGCQYDTCVCTKESANLLSCWDSFRSHCPTSFMFQTEKNLFYPFTRFLFHNSPNYSNEWYLPTHVCYNHSTCPTLTLESSLVFNGLSCIEREQIDSSDALSAKAFQLIFSTCNILNTSIFFDDKRLFYCHQSNKLISKHQFKDGFHDCLNNEDESEPMNISLVRALHFTGSERFKCATTDEWLTRPMIASDNCRAIGCCRDGSDTMQVYQCKDPPDFGCEILRGTHSSPISYVFRENCNGILKQRFPVDNETDETSCEEWPAYPCDDAWDVSDGEDELNCSNTAISYITRRVFKCGENEHYCMYRNGTMGCLSKERAGDGIVDCLGATDERTTYCSSSKSVGLVFDCFPWERKCVKIEELCNGNFDCPNDDDELVCPWLKNSTSISLISPDYYICKSGKVIARWQQCDNTVECEPDAEDEWFCDLQRERLLQINFGQIEEHPALINKLPTPKIVRNKHPSVPSSLTKTRAARNDNPLDNWYCNRGIAMINRNSSIICLCSPNYYGSRCQYQAERLLVALQIDTPVRLTGRDHEVGNIRIVARLLLNDTVVHHEQILHMPSKKQIFFLNYPRPPPKQRGNWSVRLDAFIVTTSSVDHKVAWLFNVPFSFLPFNRLPLHLLLEDSNACTTLTCVHGICKKYLNSPHRGYCHCDENWSGKQCDVSRVCSCADRRGCLDGHLTPICVCPLGRMGSHCQALFDPCIGIRCQHGGVCIPLDERQSTKWSCICSEQHYGKYCKETHAHVDVHFSASLFAHKKPPSAAVFTYFLSLRPWSPGIVSVQNRFLHRQVQLDRGLRSYNRNQPFLTDFIVLEIFFQPDHFGYYIAAIIKTSMTNITTTISETNRCPYVDELLLNETIRRFPSRKKVKYYHHACKATDTIRWFHDEAFLCFCNRYRVPDCVAFPRESTTCTTNYCKNDGRCVQNNFEGVWDFDCVCSGCSYGSLCQLTTSQYVLSLDAMLGQDIRENALLKDQPALIKILLVVLVLMLSVGFVSNVLSMLTFKQPKVQEFGCGVYLFCLPVIGQLGLTILAGRFFYLLTTQMYDVTNRSAAYWSCVSLEYFLNVSPVLFDWLTACIAVERSVNMIKGVSFRKSDSVWWAKRVIVILTIIVLGSAWHEPFIRQLIDDPRAANLHTWCVISFSWSWLEYYRLILNLINLFVPGSIVLVTSIFLLHKSTQRKQSLVSTRGEKGYLKVLRKQLPLYGSPFGLVVLSLMRLVFSFTLVCITHQWQKYVYLSAYTMSFVPLMGTFPIFVLPAKIYKTELKNLVDRMRKKLKITKI